MSDERIEQGEREDEDVEAHAKKAKASYDEPKSQEDGDDVEAHVHKKV